ncbi:uncharacterized protein PAC_06039 [Phialocephala subalpina]|uniref:3'-5' exonuclease domain-containing protein n=1 Tax=Phialocephala subalpina TaxID=576137 RepID=A0A1L7WTQ8_9HELO|nr:uncharacterized protein PAC_06039 [Phialocephala subalpina]
MPPFASGARAPTPPNPPHQNPSVSRLSQPAEYRSPCSRRRNHGEVLPPIPEVGQSPISPNNRKRANKQQADGESKLPPAAPASIKSHQPSTTSSFELTLSHTIHFITTRLFVSFESNKIPIRKGSATRLPRIPKREELPLSVPRGIKCSGSIAILDSGLSTSETTIEGESPSSNGDHTDDSKLVTVDEPHDTVSVLPEIDSRFGLPSGETIAIVAMNTSSLMQDFVEKFDNIEEGRMFLAMDLEGFEFGRDKDFNVFKGLFDVRNDSAILDGQWSIKLARAIDLQLMELADRAWGRKHVWGLEKLIRPMPETLLDYAANDIIFMPAVYNSLQKNLADQSFFYNLVMLETRNKVNQSQDPEFVSSGALAPWGFRRLDYDYDDYY